MSPECPHDCDDDDREIIDAMAIGAIIAELGEFPVNDARNVAEHSARDRSSGYMNIFLFMQSALQELRRRGFVVRKMD